MKRTRGKKKQEESDSEEEEQEKVSDSDDEKEKGKEKEKETETENGEEEPAGEPPTKKVVAAATATTEAAATVPTDVKEDLVSLLRFNAEDQLNSIADYVKVFDAVANTLVNKCTLYVKQVPYRFTEFEFYYNGFAHKDIFTHGDEMQKSHAHWYFHRSGNTYRSGTFKGMDLTFGGPAAYGGILIRGLAMVNEPRTFFDGPCVVVDHILKQVGEDSIANFVKNEGTVRATLDKDEDKSKRRLYVELDPALDRHIQPLKTPRVGLTLKNYQRTKENFIMSCYRYLSDPKLTKKGKNLMVLALLANKTPTAQIAAHVGTTAAAVNKTEKAMNKGKGQPFKDYVDKTLSPDDICTLFGCCSKQ